MASINTVMKNLSNKKAFLLGLISFFVVVLILGIQIVYAYYHSEITADLLANKVGDFDLGDGNINMMIYRENEDGEYIKINSVPSAYYILKETTCSIPCNDGLGNCEYTYDSDNKTISLTSNQKVTCKFYFAKEYDSDIEIYVLLEDSSADDTYMYNSKNYKINEVIPAYGYEYSDHYECDSNAQVTYNSETKKFSVATETENTCYVYFNKVSDTNIVVNTYVQSKSGSSVYNYVNSIPVNKVYVLNKSKSKCTAVAANGVNGSVTYEDGYINIVASEEQVCDVYLDLETN